ncbi:sensor histidine kinase [Auritidibacter ignavus]|nr:sensor histidine kinase [Auritidibacter sp. NML120636]RMX23897.1 sensor histidine kinase [Auritidibacter ignavus]
MADNKRNRNETEESIGISGTWQRHSLERVRTNTTQGLLLGLAVFWAAGLLTALDPLWHVLILLPSATLSFCVALRWAKLSRNLLVWSLLVGVLTAGVASWLAVSPLATGGLLIAGAAYLSTLPRMRVVATAGLLGVAVGLALLSTVHEPDQAPIYVTTTVVFGLFWVAVFFGSRWTVRVVRELDNAHRAQTQLALYRQKFRFAADLHDIQGHTLHVVKMKTALAQRQMDDAPDAAKQELDEVRGLLTDTISQAKSLAYGERRLTLQGELENAKNLLEATGATVNVHHADADLPLEREEPASLVLREATTNILRHSDARQVEITVNSNIVGISNDGVTSEASELSGLDALKKRVSAFGGTLMAHCEENRFITELRFPTR